MLCQVKYRCAKKAQTKKRFFSLFFVPCFSLLVLLSKEKYAILNTSFDGEFVTILTEAAFRMSGCMKGTENTIPQPLMRQLPLHKGAKVFLLLQEGFICNLSTKLRRKPK